jgi:MSHA biogenesis protein MshI
MFGRFKKSLQKNVMVAVCPTSDGIACARVRREPELPPTLELAEFTPLADDTPLADSLDKLVKLSGLHRAVCISVMEPGRYSLLLVQAPDVQPDELRQAIRWRIRELIDFHVDDAVVDVFEVPDQRSTGANRMMYAVATKAADVRSLVDALTAAGLKLEVVDIPELALRNIAALTPEDAAGVALLYLGPQRGLINVTRQKTLYLSRRIDIGLNALPQTAIHTNDPDVIESWLDRIVLEIQRSLDYFESHFAQPPIAGVLVAPLGREIPGMAEYLSLQLSLPARLLDLNGVIDAAAPIDTAQQQHCLFAIGAALRQESRVL